MGCAASVDSDLPPPTVLRSTLVVAVPNPASFDALEPLPLPELFNVCHPQHLILSLLHEDSASPPRAINAEMISTPSDRSLSRTMTPLDLGIPATAPDRRQSLSVADSTNIAYSDPQMSMVMHALGGVTTPRKHCQSPITNKESRLSQSKNDDKLCSNLSDKYGESQVQSFEW